ncbi:aconitate hydratase AcnA [Chitinophaga polysaccharea]|uniref:aconitate hydratase AcnA n=1 Tax=Chitinophaga TaxID=79328 RepID=UPI001454F8E9|nr:MULTISPECIES: aconitate hydratase AcnA [Chitinophaga]NLR61436.1 aconitate hydratase AcnA [Chitinophaga polysaccharea]NLU95272.1 aconitate hydratase AcnA [Chitinophaga sp. Ak27]
MQPSIASLSKLEKEGRQISRLPFSIRILLENVLRNHDNFAITDEHLETLVNWEPGGTDKEIPFKPARVLMQDFTGVAAVVDIASIRAEVIRKGKDGAKINPAIPVDLVVDHSVQVDFFGTDYSYTKNVAYEYERNKERYQLLKWAQQAFDNFTVVPPGMGICHQVNLEYLAKGVISRDGWLFPDTLVGTDSHTPMVNGIGVLGWGVGGIEAEAAILGQPIYFSCPQVIGLKLTGRLTEGVTATDMVLAITQLLRKYGVVDKFVEVFGDGLDHLSVPDRATISNMSPEFGCTVTYFPIDQQTLQYMRRTNRSEQEIAQVESYCKDNMLWRHGNEQIAYSDILELDLGLVQSAVAGPKRPQDRILVRDLHNEFETLLNKEFKRMYTPEGKRRDTAWLSEGGSGTAFTYEIQKHTEEVAVELDYLKSVRIKLKNEEYVLSDGAITIAAITSCTNTSNPSVMIGAGLVARKAISRGLYVKPWVKTSLAPGSRVVTEYLKRSGLLAELEALRFHIVGYGCTSCIGNSGPLPPHIAEAVDKGNLVVASVLSGNRNFEARVHPQVKMNFLASPLLVVAYAIAGRIDVDMLTAPLGYDPNGEPVYLRDIWPTQEEINEAVAAAVKREDFEDVYRVIFHGDEQWRGLLAPSGKDYHWSQDSTYIREAPFFNGLSAQPAALEDIDGARVLLKLGDSVTTDHISPAGSFKSDTPAGKYLLDRGIDPRLFNSYGSRRGNHEVMIRGTFANVRIKNELSPKEGGFTTIIPTGTVLPVYEAAMQYAANKIPLIILAGKEYGSGSSRDWAAKGTNLLGVKAVIAESYERIHRSNLVGMGVLPLQYLENENAATLQLSGTELFSIHGISDGLTPGEELTVTATPASGDPVTFKVKCKLNSAIEIEYYRHGGILQYVLRAFLQKA